MACARIGDNLEPVATAELVKLRGLAASRSASWCCLLRPVAAADAEVICEAVAMSL